MKQHKYLFIDRDGTLIVEPPDQQIDSLEKFSLLPGVILALSQLIKHGYRLVMVSNQDGLGTSSFPEADFSAPQQLLLDILQSQGIEFCDIKICPHLPSDNCECRKPKVGLLLDYLKQQQLDLKNSYVIGDRATDLALAENLGIHGILLGSPEFRNWDAIAHHLINAPRVAKITRATKETTIEVSIDLDKADEITINTGIGFFDHMLEQLVKHGGFSANIHATGDLVIDEHHTVEDTALTLGAALRQALGDKRGINRYGFVLPMDEAQASVSLDLSGRAYSEFNGNFTSPKVGQLATEMVPHFFRSLADSLTATLHINVTGDNNHHMVESCFKAVGRCLRQACARSSSDLPSTKGVL